MSSHRAFALAASGLLAWSAAGRAETPSDEAPRVFVVKPRLVDLAETALPAILDAIGQAAQDEGVSAMTEGDVAELLRSQSQLQLLGADADELSLAALGRAVGATQLITATVTRTGDDTIVAVKLIDTAASKVLARREVKASEHGGNMLDAVKVATRLVVAPVFADRRGTLELAVSEAGASVRVDGDIVGVTPMAPFVIGGGTHELGVSKESFLAHRETLRIVGGETIARLVKLRPSPDFLRTYTEDAGRMRTVAWSGTAAAVLAGGVAVVFAVLFAQQDARVKAIEADYYSGSLLEQQNTAQEFQARIDTASAERAGSMAGLSTSGAIAGVGLVAGAIGWIFGDDPGRYAEFEPAAP